MKTYLRFSLIFILAAMVLALPVRVQADTEITAITGTMIELQEVGGRVWWPGQGMPTNIQLRDVWFLNLIDADDPRISGYAIADPLNAYWRYDAEGNVDFVHVWGDTQITTDVEGTDVLWACRHTGVFTATRFDWSYVCQGQGGNKGLIAKFNLYFAEVGYSMTGFIKEGGVK